MNMPTGSQQHWETVYQEKAPEKLSWYAPQLSRSLDLIRRAAGSTNVAVLDVGGGGSTLVDDLLGEGYRDVHVLDIARAAIDVSKLRLGPAAERVHWWIGDVTGTQLPANRFDIWHDRAVFHFLTDRQARTAYVAAMARSVRLGGHVIVATFGPEGPTQCSGLDVVRYDAGSLHREFGVRFRLVESMIEQHRTPWSTAQQFLYCHCLREQ